MEIGGSELSPEPPEYGSEASAVQKPDQIDVSFLWGGYSRAKGDGPLVATLYPVDRGNSDGTSQRGYGSSESLRITLPPAPDHRQAGPYHRGPGPNGTVLFVDFVAEDDPGDQHPDSHDRVNRVARGYPFWVD